VEIQVFKHSMEQMESLIPDEDNPHIHPREQINQIVASMMRTGFTNPILIDENRIIIAGHGRLMAATELVAAGHTFPDGIPCITIPGLTRLQRKALMIEDNKIPEGAKWDDEKVAQIINEIITSSEDIDVESVGMSMEQIDIFLESMDIDTKTKAGLTKPDLAPKVEENPISREGDIWLLGEHRVMCGDSTNPIHVEQLIGRESKCHLLHADPPYGMGKEADGVANDNLYREKLDKFQMAWYQVWRDYLLDNASVYIWGNAPDLWRLWYVGGLGSFEKCELRNEIVWDKKSIPGMASDLMTQFPVATERALFFQLGEQFLGNVNADQYWEGWDEIRLYLEEQAKQADLTAKTCQKITGVQMYAHWFTKSQWAFMNEKYYTKLADATGCFQRPHSELQEIYDRLRGGFRNHVNGILGGMRSYFDNGHDTMRDVWEYSRVVGDERHGHATPKPVAMMERAIVSACPLGKVVLEPFGGSGSTLIGAQRTDRICYTMEMQPEYVDVIVKRWQMYTGKDAILRDSGVSFDDMGDRKPENVE